ncbi:MAG: 16S rRNA (cytidine(1402)-2'-O)-methyltransferase, partial [Lachnospiraceae bacterium]|nr:16S rRNA (cytidine(1402)-2'-O)-methyltransferase [Lachnospiraceae bacterium]
LGGDRRITVCRELTKRHETAFRSTLAEALAYYTENEPKGECVLVVEGKNREELVKEEQDNWLSLSIEEHMQHYESQGIANKEAMKLVAKDRGVTKRDIYQYLVEHKKN